MAEVSFYHLEAQPLEWALPRLLTRVVDAGMRAVVVTGNAERLPFLDTALWTYDDQSFLPHGRAPDEFAAEEPVWLTADPADRPNGARVLVLVDGAAPADFALQGIDRCLDMFDGRDEAALSSARRRWTEFRQAGHAVTYWQQSAEGRWEKKA
ncbi:DNA polymerase III subunit chi [Zavarzinia sp.]|uniref:DNA polymerase III subunit chi n=1 Tax=Zavarzinia sp. TaxID=2027920 RepID=UPI003BB5B444